MGTFMDMDMGAMIGKDFEAGLANLGATLAEGAAELKAAAAPVAPAPAAVVPAGDSEPRSWRRRQPRAPTNRPRSKRLRRKPRAAA
jgi:hypothetical protein